MNHTIVVSQLESLDSARPVTPVTLLDSILLGVLFIGILFPYLRISPWGSDTQPLALIAAIIVMLCIRERRTPLILECLFIPFAASVVLLLWSNWNLPSVKAVANYASIYLLSIATFYALRKDAARFARFAEWSIYIWFVVGVIQSLVKRDFATWILSGARTTEGRGVVSLAVEPTTYGVTCLLMMMVVLLMFSGRKRRILISLLIAQIVFLAQSSMSILLLVVWGVLYWLFHIFSYRGIKIAVIGVIVGGVIAAIIGLFMIPSIANTRVFYLGKLFLENPMLIFLADESAAQRLSSVVLSVRGFIDGWGMPHGFSLYESYSAEITRTYQGQLILHSGTMRSMSGYGSALFEIGWFALLIPFVLVHLLWDAFAPDRSNAIVIMVFLNLLLFTAIPLATPLVSFLIGCCAFRAEEFVIARRQSVPHLVSSLA